MLKKQEKRYRRHKRVRAKVFGTGKVPRFCVFRSSSHIYAQLINDEKGKTLVAASDLEIKKKKNKPRTIFQEDSSGKQNRQKMVRGKKTILAVEVGKLIAKKATEKKINKVVFDRGGYKYHGRVKELAEGARKEGLNF